MSVETIGQLYDRYGNIGVNRRFNISFKHGYVYSAIAKVGTTSLNHIFQKLEMEELSRKWIDFHPVVEHSPFIKPYQLSRQQLADVLFGEDYFRFLFVRDPFRRVVSAWRDKINGDRPEKKQILGALGLDPEELSVAVSFLDFLKAVQSIPDDKRDDHWASQTYLSCADCVPYHYFGRMENFDEAIRYVGEKIGLELSPYYPPEKMKNAVDDKRPFQEDYCSESIALVLETYASDFKQFGYDSGFEAK